MRGAASAVARARLAGSFRPPGIPQTSAGASVAEVHTFNPISRRYFFVPLRCIFFAVVTIVLPLVDGMLGRRAVGARIDGIGC